VVNKNYKYSERYYKSSLYKN